MDSRETLHFIQAWLQLANTFLLMRLWEIFTCRGVFIMLSIFFFSYDIVTFSFYLFFLIFCVCKISLFSLNNSIQSIVSVFFYKKVLLDMFNFLLQICNNIVMDNDR